jgi:hypothetical protein
MSKGVKIRNTTVNGGLTGRDREINKLFAYRDGNSYSSMKRFRKAGNPNSAAQAITRNSFASTSAGWSALSEGRRIAWNNDVPNWVSTGIFGNKKQSGKNLYTGVNVRLAQVGAPAIDTPGNKSSDLMDLNGSVTVVSAGDITLDITASTYDATAFFIVAASKINTAGTMVHTKTRLLLSYTADEAVNANIYGEIVAKYGNAVAGQKMSFDIYSLSAGGNKILFARKTITFG